MEEEVTTGNEDGPLRTARTLLENAEDVLRRFERNIDTLTLGFLLEIQSSVFLGLADAALYFFSAGDDDGVGRVYSTFLRALDLVRLGNAYTNVPELDLQLGYLRGLDPGRGFSLDRRLSGLGEPKPIQVWINRVIKLRNALEGRPPRDPLYEIGYGIGEDDRRFPVLLSAVRRLYLMEPPEFERLVELLTLEMKLGIEAPPIKCRGGECTEIDELPDVSGFTKLESGGVDVYYRIPLRKSLHLPWGTIEAGKSSETIVWSGEKKRGFRCVKGAV